MSQVHTAFLKRELVPKRRALQRSIDSLGFQFKLHEDFVPFQSSGFLPCRINGRESGFEIFFDLASDGAARIPNLAKKIGNRDIAITFRWSGDVTELACVLVVCVAFAKSFEAIVYDPSDSRFVPLKQLAKDLADVMRSVPKRKGRGFVAEVLRQQPAFKVCQGFFYEPPVGHVLCGFVLDPVPLHARIYSYALPLYERLEFPNLNFAEPLPGSPIDMDSERDAAAEFLRRIEPFREDSALLREPQNLLHFIEKRSEAQYGNPRIRLPYATTLIMVGRDHEAAAQLRILLDQGIPAHYLHVESDVRAILEALSYGSDAAKNLLMKMEIDSKKRLGLRDDRSTAANGVA